MLVEAISGPGKGAKATLSTGLLKVGSSESCELHINDASIARHHASLELAPGGVKVRDEGSATGTVYLGARIMEARVPVGGLIRLGQTTLRLIHSSSRVPVSERTELHGLVGHSLAMRQVFALLEQLGPSPSIVLIEGETGSGKGAVARALHALSPRADEPFEVISCAGGDPASIELELFGDATRPGALERAAGGTLLLDEVSELPLEVQPKLLRVLESQGFRRQGETVLRTGRMRVIATSRPDLQAQTRKGTFRTDLYYRLAVALVRVPSLRDRADDIPHLAAHFAQQKGGEDFTLSPATLAALRCDPWEGNLRELRNAVEQLVTLGKVPTAAAPEAPARNPTFKEARDKLVDAFERDYLMTLLVRHRSNVSAAAREAQLSRTHMYRLLERHAIDN